jgi:hypothetical protein
MVQAAVLDGLVFDAHSFGRDGFDAAEVDVSRCEVADALVVAVFVVVVDKGGNGRFELRSEEDISAASELTIGVTTLVAQAEREAISRRTKEALAVAKARGVRLGNPNGAERHSVAPARALWRCVQRWWPMRIATPKTFGHWSRISGHEGCRRCGRLRLR